MASLDELERALVNADKAGDVEAARTLAGAIMQARQTQTVNTAPKSDMGDYSMKATAMDAVRSAGSGLRSGLEMMAGTFGDARELGASGVGKVASMLGASPETQQTAMNVARNVGIPGMSMAPTTADVKAGMKAALGEAPQPQTRVGKFARTVGEFVPGAVAGPGGIGRKLAMAGASGIASEAAGQVMEGTTAEPYARIAGALLGGAAAAPGKMNTIKKVAQNAPSKTELKSQTDAIYSQLRNAGIKYDANAYGSLVNSAENMLLQGYVPEIAPKTFAILNRMKAGMGQSPDFVAVDAMKRSLGQVARNMADQTDAGAAAKLRNMLDSFESSAPAMNTAGLSASELNAMRGKARDMALRNIKARELGERLDNAKTYVSGEESGIKNQIANMLRSKKGKRLFNEAEKDALQTAGGGTPTRNALSMIGRSLGVDVSKLGSSAGWGPAMLNTGIGASLGWPVAAGAAVAGSIAKPLARTMARNEAKIAEGFLRAGPAAQKAAFAQMSADEKRKLIAAILAGRIGYGSQVPATTQ